MKVQLDTTTLRRELHKVILDDKKCAQWLREFEYTLGCWGTNDDPHPFAMRLIIEAEGYKAKQSLQKMRSAVIKELGENADDEEIKARLVAKYGVKVKIMCDALERVENLSAVASTREGEENITGAGNRVASKSATAADTKPRKQAFGQFGNVMLTDDEHAKFCATCPNADGLIEELSSYMASSGKRYKSHYATLLNWQRRKDNKPGKKTFKDIERERTSRILNTSIVGVLHG